MQEYMMDFLFGTKEFYYKNEEGNMIRIGKGKVKRVKSNQDEVNTQSLPHTSSATQLKRITIELENEQEVKW